MTREMRARKWRVYFSSPRYASVKYASRKAAYGAATEFVLDAEVADRTAVVSFFNERTRMWEQQHTFTACPEGRLTAINYR